MEKLPNRLTISRIILIFIFVGLANFDVGKENYIEFSVQFSQTCHVIAYIIAIIAGFTDFLDGWLARKYNWVSDFGALMDPLADKIFMVATIIVMVDYRMFPAWAAIVIFSREFLVTGLRLLAVKKGEVISADKWGKLKTVLQMVALLIGGAGWIKLFDLKYGFVGPVRLWTIYYIFVLFIVFLTVASGLGYFIRHRSLYMDKA
jgi:CDP-diacylglycerol--glycerol-3-phosphate 3-phosphatidyltransferase